MASILLNIHYKGDTVKKACEANDNLKEHFSSFAMQYKEKLEDFIFFYKGTIVNYKNSDNENIKISDTIFGNSKSKQFNIFAVLMTEKSSSSEEEYKETRQDQNQILPEETSFDKSSDFRGESYFPEIRRKINKQYYNDIVCPICETTAIIEKCTNESKESKESNELLLNVLNCENFHYLEKIKYDALDKFIPDYEYEKNKYNERINNNDKNKIIPPTPYFEKYICDCCSASKVILTPPEDEIYICSCGSQFCATCLQIHKIDGNQSHFYIKLEDKNYFCQEHGDKFVAYCLDCNANYCEKCKDIHKAHDTIEYNTIRVSKETVNKYSAEVDKQKETLIDFTETLRCLFDDVLNTIENYINSYIMIERGLIRRFKSGFHNYQLLRNLKNEKLFELNMTKKMKDLNEQYKEKKKIGDIFDALINNIYNPINKAKKKEQPKEPQKNGKKTTFAIINYKLKGTSKIRNIKLFDQAFVENNKDILRMKLKINDAYFDFKNKKLVTEEKDIQEIEGELTSYFKNNNHYDIQNIQIELKECSENQVTNISYMFNNCKYFYNVKFNGRINNITSMEAMFQLCKNIEFKNIINLFDKRNANELENIRAMFCKCTNLSFDNKKEMEEWFFKLPNETPLQNMSLLFSGCKGLKQINWPNWKNVKFDKLEDISYMFNRCSNLTNVGYFKYFNTSKVTNMCGLFNGCKSLVSFSLDRKPNYDIYLVTKSAKDMSIMFQGCENLEKIDSSCCEAKKLEDVSGMFANCKKIVSIKNILYYTEKISDITAIFKNCKALTSPDFMKSWKWENVAKAKEAFSGCDSLKTTPKWFSNIKFTKNMVNIDEFLKDSKFNDINKVKSDLINNLVEPKNKNEINN